MLHRYSILFKILNETAEETEKETEEEQADKKEEMEEIPASEHMEPLKTPALFSRFFHFLFIQI